MAKTNVFIFLQLFNRIIQNNFTVFHHITVLGNGQRQVGVLLHQQHGQFLFLFERPVLVPKNRVKN